MVSLKVSGMHCKSCVILVEDELEDIGASNISVILDESSQTGAISFDGVDISEAKSAIEELGNYIVVR